MLNDIFNNDLFKRNKQEKNELLNDIFFELTLSHYNNCNEYKNILDSTNIKLDKNNFSYKNLPFLPVTLFKELELKSSNEIFKVMTSSGTSGMPSKIFLDKQNALNQQKALAKIITTFTLENRMPMIVLDHKSVIKDRKSFSARGAGILGFMMFSKDTFFALNDDMSIDLNGLLDFINKYQNQKIFLFGFTFMIWKYFYQELIKNKITLNLEKAIMIHGGGWKKMINEAVSKEEFKQSFKTTCNLHQIYEYYGMIEQTGSIFMECEYGHLHSSDFGDIFIKDHITFQNLNKNQQGLIALSSVLASSYPGHLILTEDIGELLGEDDCPCGRCGKYFRILGRAKDAEIRGCSDAY